MMSSLKVLSAIFCLTVINVPQVKCRLPPYSTFEDYLQHLDKSVQTSIVQLGVENNNASPTSTTSDPAAAATTTTSNGETSSVASQIPDDEKKNITCCVLGELAGDKGFHCFAEFYAARIVLRNINRAHGRKLGFYGRFKIPKYGEKIMKTFEQCVAGHGQVFHRCCHLATLERTVPRIRVAANNRAND